ncbi:MAG: DUF2461 domain-containing protein [Acidimicrobiia bacterium]
MAFRGWRAEALEFFEGLAADNSKTYWQAHRATYEQVVKAPMDELLAELAHEFGEPKLFRPYRDVRFSPDKTPYKTHIGATLAHGGYVQLSADGLGVGSGMYHLASDQLDRFRRAVADERTGEEIAGIVAGLRARRLDVAARETVKTAPRGYAKDHPRIDLLRHKGLIVWRSWEPAAWLGTAKAKDRVVDVLRAARPLQDWLETNVGPSRTAP